MSLADPSQSIAHRQVVELQLPISAEQQPLWEQVKPLLNAATAADQIEPFGEQFLRGLTDPAFAHRHFALVGAAGSEAGQLLALAAVAGDAMELVVAPAYRRSGAGVSLLAHIDEVVGRVLPVWAHGNVPGARELAEKSGRSSIRQLLQMGIDGEALAGVADGVEKRGDMELIDLATARQWWGQEAVDRAWLRVNNEAFDWHPEQGGWTAEQLERGRDTEWFDPEGVLFAVAGADSAELAGAERIVGFHWTKWHSEESEPTGEVYVIGLARSMQGQGLGQWLTAAGLKHLVERGARRVILYVEGDNFPAVTTYQRLGFEVAREDVMYGVQASA